jgi:hypothetical protein
VHPLKRSAVTFDRVSLIGIAIIFITGHGDMPMSIKAMKSGAVDFLTKPFPDQEFLEAVTAALERDRRRRDQEKSTSDRRALFELLTPRERQVMSLVSAAKKRLIPDDHFRLSAGGARQWWTCVNLINARIIPRFQIVGDAPNSGRSARLALLEKKCR